MSPSGTCNIDTASFANITVICAVSNILKPLELLSVAQIVIKAQILYFLLITFTFLFRIYLQYLFSEMNSK